MYLQPFLPGHSLGTTCLAALLHTILVVVAAEAASFAWPVDAGFTTWESGWLRQSWKRRARNVEWCNLPKKWCKEILQMSFDSIKICISNIFSNVLETHPLLQLWIVLVLRKVTCCKGRLEDQAPSENLTEFSKITPLWSRIFRSFLPKMLEVTVVFKLSRNFTTWTSCTQCWEESTT